MFKVKDEPMTGVWADTPQGEMYFESTNDAIHSLRMMFPGTEFQFERENGNTNGFPITIKASGEVEYPRAPEIESDYARRIGATVHIMPAPDPREVT